MCLHAQTANNLIQLLMKVVYPSVQYHFLVASWKNNVVLNDEDNCTIEDIVSDLKTEFNSLFSYETKLVFSAVLRAFEAEANATYASPNINELIDLTQKKEKRIQHLLQDLKATITIQDKNYEPLKQLVTAFEIEFFPAKEDWNDMITNRLATCACFKKTAGGNTQAEQGGVLN